MINRDGPELQRYLVALRRRWPWLLGPLLLCTAAAALLAGAQEPTYQATAIVLLDESAAQDAVNPGFGNNTGLSRRLIANEVNLAEADDVRSVVRAELGLGADELLPEGEVTGDEDADLLSFSFSGATPEAAAEASNTWAEAYIEVRTARVGASIANVLAEVEQRLETLRSERATTRAELDQLETRLASAVGSEARQPIEAEIDRESRAIAGELGRLDNQIETKLGDVAALELNVELATDGNAQLAQAAVPPTNTSSLIPSVILAIGLVLGLIVGVGLALLADNLNRDINDASEVEHLGLTVLGTLPTVGRRLADPGLATASQKAPSSELADAYQRLRPAVQFAMDNEGIKTILVSSPGPGEGRTTTASNLALVFAKTETSVALVDTDFRSPNIHEAFDVKRFPGVSDLIFENTDLAEIAAKPPGGPDALTVIPAGRAQIDSTAFMTSSSAKELLSKLKQTAELVVIDGSSVSSATDLLAIAPNVGGVVLVVCAGETKRDDLMAAVDDLRRAGGSILGVVVRSNVGGKVRARRPAGQEATPVAEPASPSVILG